MAGLAYHNVLWERDWLEVGASRGRVDRRDAGELEEEEDRSHKRMRKKQGILARTLGMMPALCRYPGGYTGFLMLPCHSLGLDLIVKLVIKNDLFSVSSITG